MDFYEDGNDFGQIEEVASKNVGANCCFRFKCIENVLEESEYNGFDLDCTLLEEIIANDVNATASENSSDSGNHSPSSSSSTREVTKHTYFNNFSLIMTLFISAYDTNLLI